jgi:hypothetical protein
VHLQAERDQDREQHRAGDQAACVDKLLERAADQDVAQRPADQHAQRRQHAVVQRALPGLHALHARAPEHRAAQPQQRVHAQADEQRNDQMPARDGSTAGATNGVASGCLQSPGFQPFEPS